MSKQRKKRYARRLDKERIYKPIGIPKRELDVISLDLDEFEAIRLCDYEMQSQIKAAEEMQVSRATIQRLLLSGRKKITQAILENNAFVVNNKITNIKLKGENKMNIEAKEIKKIAFPTSDRQTVDGHFGHTKEFAVFTVENNEIIDTKYITPPPHEPGVLPRYLGEHGIDVIITGGVGQMAVNLFNNQQIDVILGANGRIDSNLSEYLGGFLTSQGSSCDHSSHTHHHS